MSLEKVTEGERLPKKGDIINEQPLSDRFLLEVTKLPARSSSSRSSSSSHCRPDRINRKTHSHSSVPKNRLSLVQSNADSRDDEIESDQL